MSIFEKKEKNLNKLINKLDVLTSTYSQSSYETEKIKTEKNEILRQKSEIEKLAFNVNGFLKSFFLGLDLTLVAFKLEMGLNLSGELVVADEISPDTCRLWDNRCDDKNARILDKDRFRRDLGGVLEGYSEVLRRIQESSS